MIELEIKTKYTIKISSNFKVNYRKIKRQGLDIDKLKYVITKLANHEMLESNFRNHKLQNNKYYKNCYECHIEPDWLLVYKYNEDTLILLLVDTGSHSELFSK